MVTLIRVVEVGQREATWFTPCFGGTVYGTSSALSFRVVSGSMGRNLGGPDGGENVRWGGGAETCS